MMNKFFGCMLAAVAISSCFSSCDEDEKISMKLQGEWHGDFYACYTCKYKQEVELRKFYAEDTYMHFVPNHLFGSTRGTGFEVDIYPANSPIKYTKYEFDWRIDDGVITFEYFDAPEMNITVENFRLTYDHFQGYFGANKSTIDLRKLDSYDFSEYVNPYELRADDYVSYYTGYDYYRGTRAVDGEELSESEEISIDDIIVSRGREAKPAE
ncbi:MAG: hypothetical protein K6E73_03210 [Bacteroidales bacterium]|nr:hypothetical protein [Bacteroidales bacterium]